MFGLFRENHLWIHIAFNLVYRWGGNKRNIWCLYIPTCWENERYLSLKRKQWGNSEWDLPKLKTPSLHKRKVANGKWKNNKGHPSRFPDITHGEWKTIHTFKWNLSLNKRRWRLSLSVGRVRIFTHSVQWERENYFTDIFNCVKGKCDGEAVDFFGAK